MEDVFQQYRVVGIVKNSDGEPVENLVAICWDKNLADQICNLSTMDGAVTLPLSGETVTAEFEVREYTPEQPL